MSRKLKKKKKLPDMNFLKMIENKNEKKSQEDENDFDFLYPILDDPFFNFKIANKKEFHDTLYNKPSDSIKKMSEILCNSKFELAPHQMFVRNFLSFQTPYNSLLLYHGLGSGKTCSAIGVAEEMREYNKRMNLNKKIIVVASPNVQDNFKLQLFDERKLEMIDGLWNIKSCTGNTFMNEINPIKMKGLSRENVIKNIEKIIKHSYSFKGYTQFANDIEKKTSFKGDIPEEEKKKIIKHKIKENYDGRMIIIDEVHNIRSISETDKKISEEITKLVENADNMRFLLLSATPMYNDPSEILWLINLMNKNDKRSVLNYKDVFDKDGTLKIVDGIEVGKQQLIKKSRGYVSFVRGENPFTFPFRIWPSNFDEEKTYKVVPGQLQLNKTKLVQPIDKISLYMESIGDFQSIGYKRIIDSLDSVPNFKDMESFGYTVLQRPIQALNIVYPDNEDKIQSKDYDISDLVGKKGLKRIIRGKKSYDPPNMYDYDYVNKKYGRIFQEGEIKKYSSKIFSILKSIENSEGVTLIYSQYIDSGVLPMALTLEEAGFVRCGKTKSLLKSTISPVPKSITVNGKKRPLQYSIISGEKSLSPNNVEELALITNDDNKDGHIVKVVIISQAGSEGLDFKFIRQVHIMEPWYNMNRIEQIIGRAVRNCSHKLLPLEKRNVMLFLHGTILEDEKEQAADIFVYKHAELKSVQIGHISRLLKENSVDCLLNIENNFDVDVVNEVIHIVLSNGKEIEYQIGDKPYSSTCDYMENCNYTCNPNLEFKEQPINDKTYNKEFISMNIDKITSKIRDLMKTNFFYKKETLIPLINNKIQYSSQQIDWALDKLINDKQEYIEDIFGRIGNLINVSDLYIFKPLEINGDLLIEELTSKLPYKEDFLNEKVSKDIDEIPQDTEILLEDIRNKFNGCNEKIEVKRGQKSWYKLFYHCKEYLSLRGLDIEEHSNNIIISHIMDDYLIDDKIKIFEYIYSTKMKDEIYVYIKEYINDNSINIKNDRKAIFLSRETGICEIYILNKGKITLAEQDDHYEIKEGLTEKMDEIKPFDKKINPIIGFMSVFKKNTVVFKTKILTIKQNKGLRCDQSQKGEALQVYNEIVDEYLKISGDEPFISEQDKPLYFSREIYCQLQEIVLRFFSIIKKDKKIWFFSSGWASLIEVEKTTFKY